MVQTESRKKIKVRENNGLWLNSDVFRQEAISFMKTGGSSNGGYYCPDPIGTPSYIEYWDEQLKRCKEGYEVGGVKITEHHYSYLNFSEIDLVEVKDDGEVVAKKDTKCPDFWDGDYDYYWALEIARNGLFTKYALATNQLEKEVYKKLPPEQQAEEKQRVLRRLNLRVVPHPEFLDGGNHMIVGKARRKGYSYKNADICKNVYNTTRKSLTVIGAFDKKYLFPEGTMNMASNYLSFLNKHTAWTKAREYVDREEHKRASFAETINGARTENGYQSDIMAISFKDNPDAGRGKDAYIILFEEAGAFPNLKASYKATKEGLEAGRYTTGQLLIFGTGGDMEDGTVDFADMFYNPMEYGLMPFLNIWDKEAEGTYCGFFHPDYMNMEGFYDEQGNSDIDGAKAHELEKRRKIMMAATSSTTLQSRMQEHPHSPSEAFLITNSNDFPIVELKNQLNRVNTQKLHIKFGQPAYFTHEDGKLKAKPDLEGVVQPLWDRRPKTKDKKGGVVIWEYPIFQPPKGLYKIGFDPYRQVDGASLAAIYVYKSTLLGSYKNETIVAQYVGRPYSPDEVNRICMFFCELYNTEVMHENEVTHVKAYFERKKKLHLLAAQPDRVISKNVNNSGVARIYGCHMIDKLKDAGEKYIKEWLLTIRDYDEHGNPIFNYETIYDPGLLEELIWYNRKKGNFDRVMAFMMVMFQIAEEDEGKNYSNKEDQADSIEKELVDLMEEQFTNYDYSLN